MGTPPMPFEEFQRRVAEINKNVSIDPESYQSTIRPVHATCLICGHEWTPKGQGLLRGNQCPNCSHSSTSFMEQIIFLAFQKAFGEGNVLNRTCEIIDGYELDVYVPSLKLAIEPGSWVWHQQDYVRQRDAKKLEYARQAGIELITIFDRFDEEEYPYNNWHYTYRWNLGYSKDGSMTLISIITDIFDKLSVSCDLRDNWSDIIREATLCSKRTTEEKYIEKLKVKQPTVMLISPYNGHNEIVEAECKICHHRWTITAYNLLRHACPECAKQTRIQTRLKHFDTYSENDSHEVFLRKLKEKRIPWRPLEPYRGIREKILFECCYCKEQVKASPGAIVYQNRLCPKCEERIEKEFYATFKRSDFDTAIAYYTELFLMKLRWINPNVTLISEYKGTRCPFVLRCNHCGAEWKVERFFDMNRTRFFCPECSGVKHNHVRKTYEEFHQQVEELHPEIELVSDEYPGALGRVDIRCRICGTEWGINVSSLLRKNGGKCPRRTRHECDKDHQ